MYIDPQVLTSTSDKGKMYAFITYITSISSIFKTTVFSLGQNNTSQFEY